jgi:hypothetical protein
MTDKTQTDHPPNVKASAIALLAFPIIVFLILTVVTFENRAVSILSMTAATCYLLVLIAGVLQGKQPQPSL